ncbi:MAG: Tfp pilus assembly protein FimT/FimU [Acidobacteriota bacterium]
MTVLELMIVLAIIGSVAFLAREGFRSFTKADLVENSTELAAVLKRASQLAVERNELYRVVLDLDKNGYVVEVCHGSAKIQRNEKIAPDADEAKRALEKGRDRLAANAPAGQTTDSDPEAATRRAIAVAGQHIADRTCSPATDTFTGDSRGKGWARSLSTKQGVKFKEVWVQHRDESVTKHTRPQPQVAIYFFPNGNSEKAVIELTDGDVDRTDGETYSVLVYGLTGRIELRDGVLRDVNDHMMKNAMGDRDLKRGETP